MGIKAEKQDFERLYERIPNEILKARIKATGEWYIKKAALYKWYFHSFSILGTAIPLSVAVINTLCQEADGVRTVTVLLSAIASFATYLLTLLKCMEKWILYRRTIERMKRALMFYWANASQHSEGELICELEKCMSEEHEEWSSISKKETQQE